MDLKQYSEYNIIDTVENILELTITAAQEQGIVTPAAVHMHPMVLRAISHVPGWFQHKLFYVQDSGVTRFGPNASSTSPIVNRLFIYGKALPLIEDPNTYFVSLDFGAAW